MSQSKRSFDIIKQILWVAIPAWVLLVGLMLLLEPKLVYPGAPATRGDYEPDFEFEDVSFESADGTKLHGWMIPAAGSNRYLLFCHGNGENVAMAGGYVARLMGQALNANVFVFDYRGYGKSAGSPNERGVLEDSHAAMNWLCDRFDIAPTDVIVNGFSIGGGPATDLASSLGCRGLILQRTFSSLTDVAQSRFPFLPVRLMMRNRFESAKKLSSYQGPLLQSHGELDRVVPIKFGRRLFHACPAEDKIFFSKPDMDHFSPLDEDLLELVSQFGDRCYDQ
jgi:fermentation-respiration switch protein FrsA (DUF1100 family)